MSVPVDLDKPLISQVLVDDRFQMVEFEALPAICFACDRYGHVKGSYPLKIVNSNLLGGKENDLIPSIENANTGTTENPFHHWIIVKRRSRRNQRDSSGKKDLGDRFQQGEFLRNLKGKGVGLRHEKVGVESGEPLLIDQMVSIRPHNPKEAMSSMANLFNSQTELEVEVDIRNTEGRSGGGDPSSAH
ncbi:hypothetical protein Gorai_019036 [Gossypium raimondii]|uniref:Zinc knuckle CX2CX4HX4C domain-containing protein n=1 Tax=Gossypium raimondii TaxID=29730 RepID=A0A7J8PMJ9_GOSRA|nr:hypothetical protein [Gossypium raimondii]